MTSRKPLIPKSLAARIRGAQTRLQSCIQEQIWAEKRIPETEAKLAAFDADPEGWSELNYPTCGGPSSYPVQTHITHAREYLARKIERRPAEAQALEDALQNLQEVEADVLAKVQSMRPTPGRVPWPKPVKDLAVQAAQLKANDARDLLKRVQMDRRFNALLQREEDRQEEKQRREEVREIRAMVAKGPEHVIRMGMSRRAIQTAFKAFTESDQYQQGLQGGWTGGLMAFMNGANVLDAERDGLLDADLIIQAAKSNGEDLWNVCSRFGLYTPDTQPEL